MAEWFLPIETFLKINHFWNLLELLAPPESGVCSVGIVENCKCSNNSADSSEMMLDYGFWSRFSDNSIGIGQSAR